MLLQCHDPLTKLLNLTPGKSVTFLFKKTPLSEKDKLQTMKKHMQLTNKGFSLYIYEMQIKTTIKYHYLH